MSVDGRPLEQPVSLGASGGAAGRSGRGAVIEARGIRKAFGATEALAGVDLTPRSGRVLCIAWSSSSFPAADRVRSAAGTTFSDRVHWTQGR